MAGVQSAGRKRRKRTAITFLWLFLPVAAVVITGAAFYAQSESDRELSRLGAEEKFSLGLGSGAVARNVHWIIRDLAFLANHVELRAAINDPSAARLKELATDWITFSRTQQDYDQIRWIDETGMERLRVDYADGKPQVVSADQLQYKGDRYYFVEVQKLNAGEIYVSPLDLNIENNVIEVPRRPTIRVGTALVDDQGVRRGLVLLNYRAKEMLQDFATVTGNLADHVMLLNADGHWLHSPTPDEEWGFMFGRSETLGTRRPLAWARIRKGDHGQFETESGLWTFDTVSPLLSGQILSLTPGGAVASSRSQMEVRRYVWKVVSHVSADKLAALRHEARLRAFAAAALILALVGFGVWQFALSAGRRSESEEALRRRKSELEEAQRIARVGSWEWIASTDQSTWSEELYRLQGRDPRQGPPTRTDYGKCLSRQSLRRLILAADHTLKAGVPFELDLEIVRADGMRGWVTARGERLLNGEGAVLGLRGTVHDITERKRIHERLVEAQKLEGIGQLTGGLAHDFNNLLGIILGNLDLLEPLLAHDKQARHYRSLAVRAGRRAAQITKSLLAVARKQALAPRKIAVAEALAEMMPLITQSVGKSITVTQSCADGRCENVVAYVDAGGLGNAILNLVVNARDAMPGGGALHMGLALRDVEPQQMGAPSDLAPGRYVVLSVADTGTGMPESVAAKAFEPFFTTKKRGQGTGLGLAMVYGFARQSGGTATISSQAGIGTTVHLYLPAVDTKRDEPSVVCAAPSEAQMRGHGEAILVVDDEDLLLEVAHEWLKRLGYRVRVNASPVEAIELLHSETFDLLLTDATMPGMSGMELAEHALVLHPSMKILVASGFAENLAHCGWPVLEKPYSRDQLAQAVRHTLDQAASHRRPTPPPHEALP